MSIHNETVATETEGIAVPSTLQVAAYRDQIKKARELNVPWYVIHHALVQDGVLLEGVQGPSLYYAVFRSPVMSRVQAPQRQSKTLQEMIERISHE